MVVNTAFAAGWWSRSWLCLACKGFGLRRADAPVGLEVFPGIVSSRRTLLAVNHTFLLRAHGIMASSRRRQPEPTVGAQMIRIGFWAFGGLL